MKPQIQIIQPKNITLLGSVDTLEENGYLRSIDGSRSRIGTFGGYIK